MDNMGEAADLDRGLWPTNAPIGCHYSVTKVLPQVLELLRRYDIRGTYFIESWNLQVYPDAIRSIANAGHEVAWHAWRHEAWNKLDEDAERANFERSFSEKEGIAGFIGQKHLSIQPPRPYTGFRPPGGIVHGDRTLKLCRTYGLQYISPAAENAAVVSLEGGKDRIAVLPFKWRTVDAYYYMESFGILRKLEGEFGEEPQTPNVLASKYVTEIEQAIEDGGFRSLLFHPFLTDRPERLEAMEKVMQHLVRRVGDGSIWLARCCDVAEWLQTQTGTVGEDPKLDTSSWR